MSDSAELNVAKPALVIIGNGMATGRLLDEIIKRTPDKFNITVIGKEPYGSYNRIMLSAVLAGDSSIDGIMQKPPQWYVDNNINFISGALVTSINKTYQTIELSTQQQIHYQQLIIATGSRTAKIPAENQAISGIFNFRDIDDTKKIQAFAQSSSKETNLASSKQAIVVGGGLLGLEAAYGLALSGVQVTLIHRNKWLMNRQLDEVAGKMLQSVMAQKNINFVLGHEVASFEDNNAVDNKTLTGAKLTNGDFIEAQIAVIATGITPNKELAQTAELAFNRAILVNDFMQTSDPVISALGECCEHENATFGLVDPIWAQCVTLAERLCNNNHYAFKNAPVPTKLKVSGVQLFSAGIVESSKDTTSFTLLDKNALIYRKIIIKNNKIIGILLFGDVSSGINYFDMMQQQINVENMMPALLISNEYFNKEENNQQNSAA